MRIGMAALAAATMATPAMAQELRDFCGDRPGLNTPPCIVDKGHLQAEMAVADWTLDKQPDSRTDTILAGDLRLRYGATDTTELRLGWTAFGHERQRDRESGMIERASRAGDITVGIKQSLMNPDGDGLSIAVLPSAIVPVGRQPIGQGTWGLRFRLPANYEIAKGVKIELTPEVDAQANEDGHGRHLAYSSVVGLEVEFIEDLTFDIDFQAVRDREPGQHQRMALAGVALDYVVEKRTQFDIGAVAGLDHAAPDMELYFGISRKF